MLVEVVFLCGWGYYIGNRFGIFGHITLVGGGGGGGGLLQRVLHGWGVCYMGWRYVPGLGVLHRGSVFINDCIIQTEKNHLSVICLLIVATNYDYTISCKRYTRDFATPTNTMFTTTFLEGI